MITVKEFQQLKDKIEQAKINKARAEGALLKIEEQLKDSFHINIDEIDSKINELESSLNKCESKKEKLVNKLLELCNWEDD